MVLPQHLSSGSLLGLTAVVASSVAASPPPPPSIQPHSLSGNSKAVCLDGRPAVVYANASTSSTSWVIQIGPGNGGAGLFCWMDPSGKPSGQLWDCTTQAKPKDPPPSPQPYVLGAGGPQDTNCTRNPDWCAANMAKIEICSGDLMLGEAVCATTLFYPPPSGRIFFEHSLRVVGVRDCQMGVYHLN